MSGHNKWSKIKNKKVVEDSKKSKAFSMHVKQITLEAKNSNGDINSPRLRKAIENARRINMPQDNIERAVLRAVGKDAKQLEEVVYESYGPGGTALVVVGITDNTNRTSQEIKAILTKNNLSLAGQGSALWAFEKNDGVYTAKDLISINDKEKDSLKNVMDILSSHEDIKDVYTNGLL